MVRVQLERAGAGVVGRAVTSMSTAAHLTPETSSSSRVATALTTSSGSADCSPSTPTAALLTSESLSSSRAATALTTSSPTQQLSFDIPTVLFYTEEAGKTYLVEPCVPGKRLNEAWWEMPEEEKEHVVTRVSEICAEIQVFRSRDLTGVDYNWLDPLQEPDDQRVEVQQQHCKDLGMDCSVFVLSHNDLGPTNIIINGNQIVVLDWEMAGYAPLEWVRTKFAICGAFYDRAAWDREISLLNLANHVSCVPGMASPSAPAGASTTSPLANLDVRM